MGAPGRDFLADDERALGSELTLAVRAGDLVSAPEPQVEDVFRAANLLALVLFRLGRSDDARALCRSEIAYGVGLRRSGRAAYGLGLALQPQINLLRMHGYLGELDDALAGLRELEQVVDGRPARFSDLDWDPQDFAAEPDRLHEIRLLARNVLLTDTCKTLLRGGDVPQLLQEAKRFETRWPKSVLGGLHHPAEAPYLVAPALQQVPEPTDLDVPELPLRRLAFIRCLHLADHFALAGDESPAGRLVELLDRSWPQVFGDFSSAATEPRWQLSLARTMLALGRTERAAELLDAASATARRHGDAGTERSVDRVLLAAGLIEELPSAPGGRDEAVKVAEESAERIRTLLAVGR